MLSRWRERRKSSALVLPTVLFVQAFAILPPSESQQLYFSPNPPACANKVALIAHRLTTIAATIIQETVICANHLGFHGGWDDVKDGFYFEHDEMRWPLHHSERACAIRIVSTVAMVSALASDIEGFLFVCFNINQGCGQSIAKGLKLVTQTAIVGSRASLFCEAPGGDQPYWSNHDLPLKGFMCWKIIWKQIKLLLQAAKYIDVAVMLCPAETAAPLPEPEPAPANAPLPEPATELSNSTNAETAAPLPEPVPANVPLPEPATELNNSTNASSNSFAINQDPVSATPGILENELDQSSTTGDETVEPHARTELQGTALLNVTSVGLTANSQAAVKIQSQSWREVNRPGTLGNVQVQVQGSLFPRGNPEMASERRLKA